VLIYLLGFLQPNCFGIPAISTGTPNFVEMDSTSLSLSASATASDRFGALNQFNPTVQRIVAH